jgi:uncharacterized protein YdcH (DUF465 family)
MADAQLPLNEDVKAATFQTDDTFRQLVTEHQALDEKIQRLSSFTHLTEQQQYEEVDLKKQKLAIKDRIEAMLRSGNHAELPRH